MRARLRAWYNAHISAAWYKSAALIGGWATSFLLLLPDLLQIGVSHWDEIGAAAFPTVPLYWKALILFVYVNLIAPPLRAWVQKKMAQAVIKQQAEAGKVVPLPASGVVAKPEPDFEETLPPDDVERIRPMRIDVGP